MGRLQLVACAASSLRCDRHLQEGILEGRLLYGQTIHPHSAAHEQGVFVAASDYLKTLPAMISKWLPRRMAILGTDGFGRSEGRTALRDFFEVDSRFVVLATLHELAQEGLVGEAAVPRARRRLEIGRTVFQEAFDDIAYRNSSRR